MGTAGPEVSWVGPGAERWEAWQSCLDPMRWPASRSQGGMEVTAMPGEDDSAVLCWLEGAEGWPGDGRGQAGALVGVHPRGV